MSDNMFVQEMKIKKANNRQIVLDSPINKDSIFEVCYFLNKLVAQDKVRKIEKPAPITIEIGSPGGAVLPTLELVSLIEELQENGYTIITQVNSYAFSGAFIILVSGSVRRARRYSSMMAHSIQVTGLEGAHQDIEHEVELLDSLWSMLSQIIVKNTKISINQLAEWKKYKLDKYFNPEQALEFGIIDEII